MTRSMSVRVACGAGCLLSLIGCGKAAPPAAAPASTVEAAGVAEKKLPPLTPVGAPSGVFLRLRVADPEKLISGGFESASIPLDAGMMWEFFDDVVEEGGVARVVDWSKPIELVGVQTPRGRKDLMAAASIGVTSVPNTVRELAERGARIEEGPDGIQYFTWEDEACAVGRSLGPSSARLVCASDQDALVALAPYVLRGLPLETLSPADVYFDFDYRPIREAYGRQIRSLKLLASVGARQFHIDEPRFDRALTDLAVGMAEELGELSEDFEGARGTLVEEKGSFHAELVLRFRGDASWTAQAIREQGKLQGPAPAVFDLLPSSVRAASYSRPLPAERFSDMKTLLVDLVGGYATSEKIPRASRVDLENLVAELFNEPGPTAQASGPLVVHESKEGAELATAWELWGTSRPKAKVLAVLESLVRLSSSPAIAEQVGEDGLLPVVTKERIKLTGAPTAQVFHWQLPKKIADLAEPLGESSSSLEDKWHLFDDGYVAVDTIDGTTWVSWGLRAEGLGEPFRILRDKSTERVSRVAALSGFRARPAVAAAFLHVDSLAPVVAPFLDDAFARDFSKLLESTPNHGRTPITYFLEVRSGAELELRLTTDVPAAFVTDAATLVTLAADNWKSESSSEDSSESDD